MKIVSIFQRRFWKGIIIGFRNLTTLTHQLDDIKINNVKVLINQIAAKGILPDIQEAEFKVFSQFGEDGIVQYLIRATNIPRNLCTFIEFGVENYSEANTRFLLMNNNWRGLVFDGNPINIEQCKDSYIYWKHDLTAVSEFITRENINQLISEEGFMGDIGLLSIDIDGNDYWVWERIETIKPIIVICEYNSIFGAKRAVTIPYDPEFKRGEAHYSNLYFGCSLRALEILGNKKGYALVGVNSTGNDAFFVRRDYLNDIKEFSAEEAYIESRFRESRGQDNKLTYLSGNKRLSAISDMQLYDIELDELLLIKSILQ